MRRACRLGNAMVKRWPRSGYDWICIDTTSSRLGHTGSVDTIAMARILVIDGDAEEAASLSSRLVEAGYEVLAASSGADGLRTAHDEHPDLLLLDLGIRDVSGTEICRSLRADAAMRSLPIIMMSESGDEIDRVVGFEVGADDFVTKPFSYRELLLRIRAILRRRSRSERVAGPATAAGLHLDPAAHRVSVHGEEVGLSALEFKLLATLHQRRNRVQTRSSLLEEVWGGGDGVSVRTVDACIKRLRQKLGSAGQLVQTVRGVGYRFVVADEISAAS